MNRWIIVIPCYNEAARLDADALLRFAERHEGRFLLVDDGSRDGTAEVLRGMCRAAPDRFAMLQLPRNMGKGEAVRQGILAAMAHKPEYVGYWDADLATPLEAIDDFCRVLEGNSRLLLAIGSRVNLLGRRIERRPLRHYLGRAFATLASLILRLKVYDTQCGAKLFRVSPATAAIFATPFCTRWIFDIEIFARFEASGELETEKPEDAIYEVALREWRDVGSSKLRMRDFLRAAWDLCRICWLYRRAPGLRRRRSVVQKADKPGGEHGAPAESDQAVPR